MKIKQTLICNFSHFEIKQKKNHMIKIHWFSLIFYMIRLNHRLLLIPGIQTYDLSGIQSISNIMPL